MKNARNIGQVNLSDFNGEVHITQKDTFSKSRQKRKKNTPKTGQFLLQPKGPLKQNSFINRSFLKE